MQTNQEVVGVIPAAGKGSRISSITDGSPKELLPCIDFPAIEVVIAELLASGVDRIVVVSSEKKPALNEYVEGLSREVDGHRIPISLAYQEEALGLGHAVLCAEEEVGHAHIIVALPDDIMMTYGEVALNDRSSWPTTLRLVDHARRGYGAILVQDVPAEHVDRYGIVEVAHNFYSLALGDGFTNFMRISDVVEKPAVGSTDSTSAIVGRYSLPPSIFDVLKETLPGAKGEIQLTDAIAVLVNSYDPDCTFPGPPVLVERMNNDERFDIGNPKGYAEFINHLGARLGERNANGVAVSPSLQSQRAIDVVPTLADVSSALGLQLTS